MRRIDLGCETGMLGVLVCEVGVAAGRDDGVAAGCDDELGD